MHQIQKDKLHVISPEAFSPKPLNEVQKRLQAILDFWGPDGERWSCGPGDGVTNACTIVALRHQIGPEPRIDANPEHTALSQARREMGFSCVVECSDSSFENARKMVLRAIALAGEP